MHPGCILKREIAVRGLSANKLALALRVPSGRITAILNGKRATTPETALRLSRFFGTSAQFWMNLQSRYDLSMAERELGKRMRLRSNAPLAGLENSLRMPVCRAYACVSAP